MGMSEAFDMIHVLYDGDCPFFARTAKLLKRLDRQHRLLFANVAARKFEPLIFNKSKGELATEIHAHLPDGSWLKGLDAFRELYSIVGFGPLVLPTKLPVLRQLTDGAYRVLCKSFIHRRADRA